MFSKRYATVVVDLPHEEKEPVEEFARGSRERRQLRACASPGDEDTADTLGMGGRPSDRLAGRILQIHTASMAILDVKTTFDVAKPSVVSKMLTWVT